MNPTDFENEIAMNRIAYEAMRERIRREFPGQYVVLARGQLVAVTTSYDEAIASIQSLCPVPECYFVFPTDEEPIFDVVTDYAGGW